MAARGRAYDQSHPPPPPPHHYQQQRQQWGPAPAGMASGVRASYDQMLHELNYRLMDQSMIGAVSRSTGYTHAEVAVYGTVLVSAIIVMGFGWNALCHLVGFVYPFYASMMALESPDGADDTKMLTYWLCFSTLTMVETFTDIFLHWIPFYYCVKLIFLVWCFLPATNGAALIYRVLLRPLAQTRKRWSSGPGQDRRSFPKSHSEQEYQYRHPH